MAADADEYHGCTDGGCVFGHPGGMHTNGGCHCIPTQKPTHEERARLRDGIKAMRAEILRMRKLGVPAENDVPVYELRREEDGTLDELVVRRPHMVALERMAEGGWQLRVFMPGEGHVYVDLWTRGGRAHITPVVSENP